MYEIEGLKVPIKIWTDPKGVEDPAKEQLMRVASLPWVYKHVAVMPDVHHGKGCTVGSVIAMRDAVAPAAVGVDIGCGMAAIKTTARSAHLPDSLAKIRADIEAAVPILGHERPQLESDDLPHALRADVLRHFSKFEWLDGAVQNRYGRACHQVGTLGRGNHFIELCIDTEGWVWLMLHSGSRNVGKELADVHISRAKELTHNRDLDDPDLAVFLADTPEMQAYRHDLYWAQEYARLNREAMLAACGRVLGRHLPGIHFVLRVACHHNYVAEEEHFGERVFVTRKGAISAREGELGIIPGSMGARSFIVEGLGSPESFHSASHGAGRRMSRGKARRTFTVEQLKAQTHGVECRKDDGVIDEIPDAYKDIDEVMANQKDLVRIKHELKQVLCVKG